MPADRPVERVEHSVGDGGEQPACGSGEPHRAQELDSSRPVPDKGAIAAREMPAREALVLGERLEELRRLLVVHREQRELLSPVEEDDDPRRPAAEPSTGVVEEDRAAARLYGLVASSNPSSTARTRVPISSRS